MSVLKIITATPPIILKVSPTWSTTINYGTAWYVASGAEGNEITLDGSSIVLINGVEVPLNLTDRVVTAVNKDNYELKPTLLPNPGNKEFNWETAAAKLTFGSDLQEGEQIKITYI